MDREQRREGATVAPGAGDVAETAVDAVDYRIVGGPIPAVRPMQPMGRRRTASELAFDGDGEEAPAATAAAKPEQLSPGAKIAIMVFDSSGKYIGGTIGPLLDEIEDDMFQAERGEGDTWTWDKELPELRLLKLDSKTGKRLSGGPSVIEWLKRQPFHKRAHTILVQFDIAAEHRTEAPPELDVLDAFDDESAGPKGKRGKRSTAEAGVEGGVGTGPRSQGQGTTGTDTSGAGNAAERTAGGRGNTEGTVSSGRTSGDAGGLQGNSGQTGVATGRRSGQGHANNIVENPNAEMSPDSAGGTIADDGGRIGGAAGGEVDSSGGGVAGAGAWWDVISVSASAAPIVAAAMIISDADLSGAGKDLFLAARKIGKNSSKVAEHVTKYVDDAVEKGLAKLKADPDFIAKSADEQAEILAAATLDLQATTRERIAKQLDQEIADYEAMAKSDMANEQARQLATENAETYRDLRAALDAPGGAKTRGKPEAQLSPKGRTNPSPLTPDEAARIEIYQQQRNGFLKKWRDQKLDGIPDDSQRLLQGKGDSAIEHSLTPDDLSAVIKEKRGDVIKKADGTAFDHITEFNEARRAVIKNMERIKERIGVLQRTGGAVAGELDLLQDKLGDLSRILDSYEKAAGQ